MILDLHVRMCLCDDLLGPGLGQRLVGSLAGAAHLLNLNTGDQGKLRGDRNLS